VSLGCPSLGEDRTVVPAGLGVDVRGRVGCDGRREIG
jgi:hypothetical protein